MKTTFNTYLPVFTGFYSTLFEADEEPEIDHINEQRIDLDLPSIDYNDCKFDYEDYENRVANRCVSAVYNRLRYYFPEIEIEFQNIYSPREYNFGNDSINVAITIDLDKVVEVLNDNVEAFKTYIKERYTSCDGFISYHSSNYINWIEDIKSGDERELRHKLGAVLDFILEEVEDYKHDNLYEDIVDETYINAINYEELTTK